ncbi:hypothetical protein AVEN_157932-1 [Araneus ventricosus]|uniref:Uncharacterized protein n=1 Tax=Araneus ventricosus TaxID=182803 RepID=A0A4Y2HA72_ARAVE|nr:hypothetical protein AVEN_157932-1 [Araneus ventricosus]
MEGSHENSVSFQATSSAMMYFAALLVFGSIVEFSTVGAREIQCSPTPCNTEAGCKSVQDYPCAKCVCPNDDSPDVGNSCSMPNCNATCPLNKYSRPCPTCECGPPRIQNRRRRHVQCSLPQCPSPCKLTYPDGSCPQCDCQNNPPEVECSPPKCDEAGCYMDYSTKPCASCICSKPSTVQCGTPRCDDGCTLDYSTQPCPSCQCNNPSSVQCSTPNCNQGCVVDYSTKPCASCKCNNAGPSQGSGSMASANTHRGYYRR